MKNLISNFYFSENVYLGLKLLFNNMKKSNNNTVFISVTGKR